MDLSRPISYRGEQINTLIMLPGTSTLEGIEVTSANMHSVGAVGFTEKRASDDGVDASDVTLDRRIIDLSGTIYGRNRATLYEYVDMLNSMFAAPTAYAEDPDGRGYLPLLFETPSIQAFVIDDETLQGANPGVWQKQVYARPLGTCQFTWVKDRSGGDDDRPMAVNWAASLECKDPTIYAQHEHLFSLAGYPGPTFGKSWEAQNWGRYPTPFVLVLKAQGGAAHTWNFTGLGTSMHFTFPAIAAGSTQTITYDSRLKVVYRQTDNGVPALAMDALTFDPGFTHGRIHPLDWDGIGFPSLPDQSMWEFTFSGTKALLGGSQLRWRDAFI